MQVMQGYADKQFDLAICDPPYGLGMAALFNGHTVTFKPINEGGKRLSNNKSHKTIKPWDSAAPDESFFKEVMRVSKFVVLWGANHYLDNIPPPKNASCWITWDKKRRGHNQSDCELAWTNFNEQARMFEFMWSGCFKDGSQFRNFIKTVSPGLEQRYDHPTQKPVDLYTWILDKFAKPGWKILDPMAGTGPCALACALRGYECTVIEADADYINIIQQRMEYLKKVQAHQPLSLF
jgi:site-specific DNA-methyltransferase (adenine-specific)